jgi:hypothetical protein
MGFGRSEMALSRGNFFHLKIVSLAIGRSRGAICPQFWSQGASFDLMQKSHQLFDTFFHQFGTKQIAEISSTF